MSDIITHVQSRLSTNATITALVPAARIRAYEATQELTRPYIVHKPISGTATQTSGSFNKLRQWDYYQISVLAETVASLEAVKNAIRAQLGHDINDGVHMRLRSEFDAGSDVLDNNVRLFQWVFNFYVAESF